MQHRAYSGLRRPFSHPENAAAIVMMMKRWGIGEK